MAKEIIAVGNRGIKLSERKAIEAYADQVNGRASNFTVSLLTIERVARDAEKRLADAKVPQGSRVGVSVIFFGAGPARSYKYSVASSAFKLVRHREGWRLMTFENVRIYPGQRERVQLSISDELAEDIQTRALKEFKMAA